MTTKNGYVRIEKWIAKFSGERQGVASLLSKTKATMEIKQRFAQQYQDEVKTKLILAEAGTPRMMNPFYINFTREVRSILNQGLHAEQLLIQVDIFKAKAVGRGLDTDIIDRIRNTCFTLTGPTP